MSRATTGIFGSVLSAVRTDPKLAERFRAAFIAPTIAVSQAIYDRAQARGEIRADIDIDIVGPALAGILLYRTLATGAPIDDATTARIIDHVIIPAVQEPSV
jgi:hypothetical protein